MADFGADQAEGLRRMLDHNKVRVISVASGSPGVGKSSVVINIAAALARVGRRVLIIDENYGPLNIAGLLGLRPRFDLKHVIEGSCTIEDALLAGFDGIAILAAAIGARSLAKARHLEQERLIESFRRLDARYDVVLIDAVRDGSAGPFGRTVQDTIIVTSDNATAITEGYALIKRMRTDKGRPRFHVLLNRVTSEPNAQIVFTNMKTVAQRHLGTGLECLGVVLRDDDMRRAAQRFQPVSDDAFAASPSAARFRRIAETIARWPGNSEPQNTLDSFMQRLLLSSRFAFANAGA